MLISVVKYSFPSSKQRLAKYSVKCFCSVVPVHAHFEIGPQQITTGVLDLTKYGNVADSCNQIYAKICYG